MDVDSTAQEPPPSSAGAAGAGGAGSSGSRGDKRQGGQQLGGAPSAASSANGKTGTVAGALVPDTAPQFAVSRYGIIILWLYVIWMQGALTHSLMSVLIATELY